MEVTFNIPDAIVPELNSIAQSHGFANAKQMVIHYLKKRVKRYREEAATQSVNVDDVEIT